MIFRLGWDLESHFFSVFAITERKLCSFNSKCAINYRLKRSNSVPLLVSKQEFDAIELDLIEVKVVSFWGPLHPIVTKQKPTLISLPVFIYCIEFIFYNILLSKNCTSLMMKPEYIWLSPNISSFGSMSE